MGDRLVIEGSVIDFTVQNLRDILDEFTEAEEFSRDLAEKTSHSELRNRVEEFANSWNLKRAEMLEQIQGLYDLMVAIKDAFDETDAELRRSLEEAANEQPSSPAPGNVPQAV